MPSGGARRDPPPSLPQDGGRQSAAARHSTALAAAREQVQRAEAAHEESVGRAQERLTRAGADLPVQDLGPWRLGRLSLHAGARERALTTTTRFEREVVGSIVWVTRTVDVSPPHLQPDLQIRAEQDDRRRLRVRVSDHGWQEEQELPAHRFDEGERFVAAGSAAVRSLSRARADRQERIAVALAELERVRADRARVDVLRMTVEDLQGAAPGTDPAPPRYGGRTAYRRRR